MRHLRIIRQKLFGIFGQAVAAIAKGRVVVMPANARIHSDTFDNLAAVEIARQGIAVQFVKKRHAHRQIGVGEQFDRLGLIRLGEKQRHIIHLGPATE